MSYHLGCQAALVKLGFFTPVTTTGLLGGAALGGAAGYFGTDKEEDAMTNALIGAGAGGFVGLGTGLRIQSMMDEDEQMRRITNYVNDLKKNPPKFKFKQDPVMSARTEDFKAALDAARRRIMNRSLAPK